MNKATFYIGIERDGEGRQIDPARRALALDTLRRAAADVFGGYSLSHIEGGWINDKGALVAEGALRLEVYTDKAQVECRAFGERARAMFDQSAVLMDVATAPGVEMVAAPVAENARVIA